MRHSWKTLIPTVVFSVIVSTAGAGWAAPGQADNLARAGTPSASYTSPWESVAALNDGIDPPSSNDTQNRRWGTWPDQGQQWAEIQWSTAQTLRSADVYFFDDNGGVRLPASWRMQSWNGSSYVDIPATGGYPAAAANRYNAVNFPTVQTQRLRILMQSGQASVGVLEIRAYATPIDGQPPTSGWNPPAHLVNPLNAVWQHYEQTYGNLYGFRNYGWDQVMANGGYLNFCVRWDSPASVTVAQREAVHSALRRQVKKWMDVMAGHNNWPYTEVPVNIVGWAVRDRGQLQWSDNAVDITVNNIRENAPQCNPDCGRFFHQDGNYSQCPGGAARHYDQSLWLTAGMSGGAGGDWGQRVGSEYFMGAVNADNIHIFLHEMGHTFGLDDFYDWDPLGGAGLPHEGGQRREHHRVRRMDVPRLLAPPQIALRPLSKHDISAGRAGTAGDPRRYAGGDRPTTPYWDHGALRCGTCHHRTASGGGPEMAADRNFADAETLTPVMREVFGSHRRIAAVDRLLNGTKKGVYRVTLDDATSAIVYVWNADEDYWDGLLPEGHDDPSNPFAHASGIDYFEGATRRLKAVGVRSPRLLLADRSKNRYPADIAVAEDVRGGTLEALLERDPDAGGQTLAQLSDLLRRMHAYRAPAFGRVAWIDSGGTPPDMTCEQAYLERALVNIATAVSRDARAAEAEPMLERKLRILHAALDPRAEHGVVHGELGPDHALVGPDGEPVLIDIEGLMYTDIEVEHCWMRMRFGPHYETLRNPNLDPQRVRYYQYVMHLDLIGGPLRIAEGDSPNRQWMLDVANFHLQRALAYET